MARAILLVGAVAWMLAAVAGVGLAVAGVETLLGWLPPLTVDADAVRGAVLAIAVASAAIAAAHVVALLGIRRDRAWASTAAILLGGVLATLAFALAVAAATSAAVDPANAVPLASGAVAGAVATLAYAAATLRLVEERRRRSRPSRPS